MVNTREVMSNADVQDDTIEVNHKVVVDDARHDNTEADAKVAKVCFNVGAEDKSLQVEFLQNLVSDNVNEIKLTNSLEVLIIKDLMMPFEPPPGHHEFASDAKFVEFFTDKPRLMTRLMNKYVSYREIEIFKESAQTISLTSFHRKRSKLTTLNENVRVDFFRKCSKVWEERFCLPLG